jgi:hypothetical protein
MSRITKDIAQEVADKMVVPALAQVEVAHKKLKDAMWVIMDNRTPQIIKDAFAKNPEYFDTIERVYVQGNGFNGQEIKTSERFISQSGNYSTTVQPTEAECKLLWELYVDWEKQNKECVELKSSIFNTLYSLRTYAQVGKNFEEAVPFLPEKTSTELSVPIDNIREKLNFYASKTEQTTKE